MIHHAGVHVDYYIYDHSKTMGAPTDGTWYCANVNVRQDNQNVSRDVTELLQRLDYNCKKMAGVCVVMDGSILEIKWPTIKQHNLRLRDGIHPGYEWATSSNMTFDKALRAIKTFDTMFNELLATPSDWPNQ